MSLEFGSGGFSDETSRVLEGLKPVFGELDELQKKFLESNSRNLEFIRQSQSLSSRIEISQQREFANSQFQETPLYRALMRLRTKCQGAKSIEEINAIKAEYEKLVKPIQEQGYKAAIAQTGINAQAALVQKGVLSGGSRGIENNGEISLRVADTAKQAAEHQEEVTKEALRRIRKKQAAVETAAKAQEYYSSLSDVTTGKSAKESAEVLEKALKAAEEHKEEALKRIKAEETAKQAAENAQKYYFSLSNSATGKSAKESAEVLEKALKAAEEHKEEALKRIKAEEAAKQAAENAQKYYFSLSNSVTGKSAQESAAILEAALNAAQEHQQSIASQPLSTGEGLLKPAAEKISEAAGAHGDSTIKTKIPENYKNIRNKFNTFVKEKVIPYTKTKKFKYLTAGTAVITATAAFIGISTHKKNKKASSKTINVIK